jgi:hypothetical protein
MGNSIRKGAVSYAIGAMLLGMAAAGSAQAQTTGGVTLPALSSDLALDLTPVRDVYNLTVAASLGIAGYRKAGVAAKKW